jgi:hypothetical protein
MIAILQINPQIKVLSPLGFGYAFFIIDYGPDVNPVFVVRLDKDGQVKNFDSNSIKIDGNPMYGLPFLKEEK